MKGEIIKLIGLLGISCLLAAPTQAKEYFQIEDGKLRRPTGYREWIHVGTPVTPNDLNDGAAAFPEFHNVYIDPESWNHWKKTGEFRDGTVMIKELISVSAKGATSGNGYFMGDFIGLEAEIKSSKYFPDEPGNWAYFSFTQPDHESLAKEATAFPTTACNACHDAAAADDWVFTQYYPVLRGAKAQGEKGIGGTADGLKRAMRMGRRR
jgi:hypothetical protein